MYMQSFSTEIGEKFIQEKFYRKIAERTLKILQDPKSHK